MHHYLQHAPQTTRSHAFYCTKPKIKAQCIHHTCDLPNPYNYINYIHSKININLLYKYSQMEHLQRWHFAHIPLSN
jgi:hypothetical protein